MIELCEKERCTGCAACLNVCPDNCIEFVASDEGFKEPFINHEECSSCGLCMETCPELSPLKNKNSANPKVYAAWSLDKQIRIKSSSGGIFSVIASYVIQKNGYVYGAYLDENWEVRHIGICTTKELEKIRVSKYVQSNIGNIYREIRNNLILRKKVLFCGTPCQVAGLSKYLGDEYMENLITIDLVCHGVPSPELLKIYLQKLSKKITFEQFLFRNINRWKLGPIIKHNNKWIFLKRERNIYFQLYIRNYIQRESCYNCQYACIPRVGDITLGDFWGLGLERPFKHNTEKGVNMVMLNNTKVFKLFERIKDKCFLEERSINEATKYKNKAFINKIKREPTRDIIYSDFKKLSLEKIEEKYIFPKYSKWIVTLKRIRRSIVFTRNLIK